MEYIKLPSFELSETTKGRIFALLSVLSFCAIITLSKLVGAVHQSTHSVPHIALIKAISSIVLGLAHSSYTKTPLYVREGQVMETILVRGLLVAVSFLSVLYGTKYIKSSTFAIISRTKVYISLILTALFNKENIDLSLLILSIVSFIGISLVVDSSVFGIGAPPEISLSEAQTIEYWKNQMLGILFCFVYVIANAISKFFETIYMSGMNQSQFFFFLELFALLYASFMLMNDPFYFKEHELTTYLLLPLATVAHKYTIIQAYLHKIDFAAFIIIQSSIVFFTFLIDVFIFGKPSTIWNYFGGLIVIVTSVIVTFKG